VEKRRKIILFLVLLTFLFSGLSGCIGCIDISSPNVIITSPADASAVSGIVTVKAEANDDVSVAKVEFYIDGNKVGESNNSPYTYEWDTSNLQYGTSHCIQAKAYDSTGKFAESPIVRVTVVDAQAPTVTITNPQNGSTVSGTVTIQAEATDRGIKGKAPSGIQKVEFYIDGTLVGADTTSPYTYSWNTDSLQYGSTHTIQAKAYDNTGRVGVSPEVTVVVGDVDAPIVNITNPQNGSTVSGTVTIQAEATDRGIKGKAPSGIQKVEFYIDGTLVGADTTSPYSYSWNTDSLQYGSTHTIQAKAYDNAGRSGISPEITVVIGDEDAPIVTIINPSDGSTVSGTVTIQAEATDRGIKGKAPSGIQKVEFYIDGTLVGADTTSPYTYSWNTDSLQYGSTHTIQAKAYDNAGRSGISPEITVVIGDEDAPIVNITNPQNGSTVSGTVTIQAEATDRSIKGKAPSGIQKVEFYIDGTLVGADTTSPYTYSWNTDSLQYGSTHTIQAKAYDNTGRVGVSPEVTVTIGDTVAPTITITNPQDGGTVFGTVVISASAQDRGIKGKAPSGIQKVEFYVDGDKIGEDNSSPYTYSWDTDSLQYGSIHLIQAKAYDNAGNVGESSVIRVTIGDGQAPTVTITKPSDGETVSGTVTIQAEATDRGIKGKAPSGIQKVEFYIDGALVGADTTSPYTYSWNTDSLQYGSTHTIQAKAYDNTGRSGESSIVTVIIGDVLPPAVTITNPQDGAIVPGSAIITIEAEVQDRGKKKTKASNDIAKIEFYLDGNTLLGVATSSPYQCTWDTSGLKHNTTHTITAKAYDRAGNTSETSIKVSINVEWTILMYLDGHNDLYQALTNELNLLNNVTSTAGINVVILAGLSQTNPLTSLYYFHNGTLQELNSYYCNFGNPSYLQEFLSYGIQNYPAKKYMVVIKNHGSGWKTRAKKNISRDIAYDEIYGDSLTIPELRSALYYTKILLGKKIDLLYLDACLMGTIEVDYEIKDMANYLVSSEAIGWSGNTRWDILFNQLVTDPTISADSLGILTAQTYFDSYIEPRTIAVKNLSKIEDIVKDIYNFAHYLRPYVSSHKTTIMNLRNQTQSFAPYLGGPNEYIDLYQFAELIRINSGMTNINLLNSIIKLEQDIESSLLYENNSGYLPGTVNGYSIWFPEDINTYNLGKTKYEQLLFTIVPLGKEWEIFLEEILTP